VSDESTHVDTRRMLWLAPLTIAASVVAVLVVREVAIRVVHPSPGFMPLTLGSPILDTILGCLGRGPGFRDDRFFPGIGAYLPAGCGWGSFLVVYS
jgi:hypothetical protein